VDPIHQFEIKTLFPIAKIGNVEIAFTNSALYMLIAVGIIALLMIGLTSRRAMVPGRFQALAEVTHCWTRGNEILSSGVLAVHVHSCP
jgi:F-type H+-transporting ATPase subunit a